MRCVISVLILLAIAPQAPSATAPQGQTPTVAIESLTWLAGCWSQVRADGITEEHWMRPLGGSMFGMSRTVAKGRTVEYEFIRIAVVDGVLTYVAKPSGQAEAAFPLKSIDRQAVVFENATHDFPQRVMYRTNADGTMTARIEGTVDGQSRARDFPYARCRP